MKDKHCLSPLIQGLQISSEIAKDGVVIFEEDLPDLNAQLEEIYK